MSVNGFDINGTIVKYDYNELDNAPIEQGTGSGSVLVVNETYPNIASGDRSFSAGGSNTASGENSMAIGYGQEASGGSAIALGGRAANQRNNTASGQSAVALGSSNLSSGNYSLTAGVLNEANTSYSSAIGYQNRATGRSSFVIGQFNTADENEVDSSHGANARKYLFIIGNGTADNARSNAMTVDWDGNGVFAGKLTVGAAPTNNMDVATKQYVDQNAGGTPEIFWATYGTTTSAEIEAAYQAGKICAVNYSNRVYLLSVRTSATSHTFAAMTVSTAYRVVCSSNTWSNMSKTIASASSATPAALGTASAGSSSDYSRADHVHDMPSASDVGAAPEITEVTVSTTGAVTQALDVGKLYHFTGVLTSLTITLNAAGTGVISQYHFDFDCGSTAPTVTIPNTITMPSGNTFEASKHYEVDILNNYGVVASWATS